MAINTPPTEEEEKEELQSEEQSQKSFQDSLLEYSHKTFGATHLFAEPNEIRKLILEAHSDPKKLEKLDFRVKVEDAISKSKGWWNSRLIGSEARDAIKDVSLTCQKYKELAKIEAEKKTKEETKPTTDQKKVTQATETTPTTPPKEEQPVSQTPIVIPTPPQSPKILTIAPQTPKIPPISLPIPPPPVPHLPPLSPRGFSPPKILPRIFTRINNAFFDKSFIALQSGLGSLLRNNLLKFAGNSLLKKALFGAITGLTGGVGGVILKALSILSSLVGFPIEKYALYAALFAVLAVVGMIILTIVMTYFAVANFACSIPVISNIANCN